MWKKKKTRSSSFEAGRYSSKVVGGSKGEIMTWQIRKSSGIKARKKGARESIAHRCGQHATSVVVVELLYPLLLVLVSVLGSTVVSSVASVHARDNTSGDI